MRRMPKKYASWKNHCCHVDDASASLRLWARLNPDVASFHCEGKVHFNVAHEIVARTDADGRELTSADSNQAGRQ